LRISLDRQASTGPADHHGEAVMTRQRSGLRLRPRRPLGQARRSKPPGSRRCDYDCNRISCGD
jgi:hypothetical protein